MRFYFIGFLLAIVFLGCSKEASEPNSLVATIPNEEVIQSPTTTTDGIETEFIKDESSQFLIDVAIPKLVNGTTHQDNINQQIRTQLNEIVAKFKNDSIEFIQEQEEVDPTITSDLHLSYSICQLSEKLLSIAFVEDAYYAGAAHPNQIAFGMTFDLKTGNQLKLPDFFKPKSTYLDAISELSRSQLKQDVRLQEGYDVSWFQNGTATTLENFQSFCVSENALNITFNAYQIAAYVYGSFETAIQFDQLKQYSNGKYF